MTQNNYTDELYHYGRKGMRWGQHIFGKEPTGSSRKRSGKKSASPILNKMKTALDDRKKKKEEAEKAERRTKVLKGDKKLAKEMSNEELADAIKHLELEQRYNTLTEQTSSRGREFTKAFFERAIIPGTTAAASKLMEQGLMKLGKKYLGLDDEKMKTLQDKAADAKSKFEIADYENKLKNVGKDNRTAKERADDAEAKWREEKFKRKLENEDFTKDYKDPGKQNDSNNGSKKKTDTGDSKETFDKAKDAAKTIYDKAKEAFSGSDKKESSNDSDTSNSGTRARKPTEEWWKEDSSSSSKNSRRDTIEADWYDSDSYDSGRSTVSAYLNSGTKLLPSGNSTQMSLGSSYVDELLR